MATRKIQITKNDMDRLRELLRSAHDPLNKERPYLEALRAELDRAKVVASEKIEPDVVTMNSRVRIEDADGRSEDADGTHDTTLTLVFPEDADPEENRISVLAPLGAAMLGYRVGDAFSFRLPGGTRTCKIVEILYQPEAAGDLHL